MRKARAHLVHTCRRGSSPIVLSSRSMMPPREQNDASQPVNHEDGEPRAGCQCLPVLAHAARPRSGRERLGFFNMGPAQVTRRLACRARVFSSGACVWRPQMHSVPRSVADWRDVRRAVDANSVTLVVLVPDAPVSAVPHAHGVRVRSASALWPVRGAGAGRA